MSHYTSAERKRMNDAISAHDRCVAVKNAVERLARLTVLALGIFMAIFLFYVASN